MLSSVGVSALSSSSSSSVAMMGLYGRITYDFIPSVDGALMYEQTVARPSRGIRVELLDAMGNRLQDATTAVDGTYRFDVPVGQMSRVRAYAAIQRDVAPRWDFRVTDNTNNDQRYAMEGALLAASMENTERNLHAASGWGGASYTQPRAAAPFAIIDSVYESVLRVADALEQSAYVGNLPPLELRWSPSNKPVEGIYELGEIGTSSYTGEAIYLLGSEDNDTDEYDRHVIFHEFVHYIEHTLGRLDNIGGEHWLNESLDFRLAYSEGLANALSGAFAQDTLYSDAGGTQQAAGFSYTIDELDDTDPLGFFSELATQTFVYSYYAEASNDLSRNLRDIISALTDNAYQNDSALHSVYTFASSLERKAPSQRTFIDSLLAERRIVGKGSWAEGETYFGQSSLTQLYVPFEPDQPLTDICVSSRFGGYNKLENTQFLRLTVKQSGHYNLFVTSSDDQPSNIPEWTLFKQGKAIERSVLIDGFSAYELDKGDYVLALTERRISQGGFNRSRSACFELSLTEAH